MTPVKCNKYRVDQMCDGRRYATQQGRFGYDPKRKGYYSLDLPSLECGVPMILEGCCFCFEELPSHFIHGKPKDPPHMSAGDATCWNEEDE